MPEFVLNNQQIGFKLTENLPKLPAVSNVEKLIEQNKLKVISHL
jgi:hypothetical protein